MISLSKLYPLLARQAFLMATGGSWTSRLTNPMTKTVTISIMLLQQMDLFSWSMPHIQRCFTTSKYHPSVTQWHAIPIVVFKQAYNQSTKQQMAASPFPLRNAAISSSALTSILLNPGRIATTEIPLQVWCHYGDQ
jgi:hypothetical protein